MGGQFRPALQSAMQGRKAASEPSAASLKPKSENVRITIPSSLALQLMGPKQAGQASAPPGVSGQMTPDKVALMRRLAMQGAGAGPGGPAPQTPY